MLFGFLDVKTALLIAHVFGAVLGAGGAFTSDSMFFSTVKDGRIERNELRFLRLGSVMVWGGLAVLFFSGVGLVALDPARYLASTKFLAKVTIVAVIALNGLVFHLVHLPHLTRHVELQFSESPTFLRKASFLMASGAISVVSWSWTVALGVIRGIPYSYGLIVSVYAVTIFLAVGGALFLKSRILHLRPKERRSGAS